MNWCFAIINGRLAEIFFEKKRQKFLFLGHVYVKESDYSSKKEKLTIKMDTAKYWFSYRKGEYQRKPKNI